METDPVVPRIVYDPELGDYEVPKGYEMVDGQLVAMPHRYFSSAMIAGNLHYELCRFLDGHPIGIAMTAGAPYRCFQHDKTRVRKPAVSVILCDPKSFIPPEMNYRGVPDLVVEVISPDDLATEHNQRLGDYIRAGVRLIWLIFPSCGLRNAIVHRADNIGILIRENGILSGEDVLPGFSLPLAAILPPKATKGSATE